MRKGLLITMAALAGCWAAGAQEPARFGANTLAAFTPPVMQGASHRDASLIRAPQLAATNESNSATSWLDSSYDFTMTPFEQFVQVPVVSLAGGRFQLNGCFRMLSVENFQMGLPGGGSLPAWSIGEQSHLLVVVPRMDQGAGFSVSLRLHGTGLREMHWHAYHTVNHALAFVLGG